MASRHTLFTSESVTEGHPDKICDQVSDGILDAIIGKDKACRVAVETLVTTGLCVVGGEVTTTATIDTPKVVRDTIRDIGYNSLDTGYSADHVAVMVAIGKQSPDIAMGTKEAGAKEQGAGDQGLMFGYATNETPSFMPTPISLAHALTSGLSTARRSGAIPWLWPDGKSQVTVEYEDQKPVRVDSVVLAAHHRAAWNGKDLDHTTIKRTLIEKIVKPSVPKRMLDEATKYHINETGAFVVGGPVADSGCTGRKIIVDTYGGWAPHGGGAFSGKDPSKVDRSAAYASRWIAKNVVAAGLAARCLIQVAYAIGVAKPVSIRVDTQGTNTVAEERIEKAVDKVFDLRPKQITERLDLLRPIYRKTAAHGHFGRDAPEFTWERTDMAAQLKKAA